MVTVAFLVVLVGVVLVDHCRAVGTLVDRGVDWLDPEGGCKR